MNKQSFLVRFIFSNGTYYEGTHCAINSRVAQSDAKNYITSKGSSLKIVGSCITPTKML